MSSLATQLAQSASLNAGLLVDRSRRKPTESYLFSGKEVDAYDLESIHALALNGFLQLTKLDSALKRFQGAFFGEHAKGLDRTLLSQDEAKTLDSKLEQFLQFLGRWIMETPTGCVIEWLVRRFRINEFNIPTVLGVFLPYHDSVHFAKMLSILHIKQQATWAFLLPFKSAAQSLPRMPLVTEMLQNNDVARFVISLLPAAVAGQQEGGAPPHPALIAFNAACTHEFLARSERIDEGTAAFLMPALLTPLLAKQKSKDAVLGSVVLLTSFSRKCTLSPAALGLIIQAILEVCSADEQAGVEYVTTTQFLKASISLLDSQEELDTFEEKTFSALINLRDFEHALKEMYVFNGVEKLLLPMLPSLTKRAGNPQELSILESILAFSGVPESIVERATELLLEDASSSSSHTSRDLLSIVYQRHHPVFTRVFDKMGAASDQSEALANELEQLRISLSVAPKRQKIGIRSAPSGEDEYDEVLASTSVDSKIRVIAIGRLLNTVQNQDSTLDEKDTASLALLARVQDVNPAVLDALYSKPEAILPILSANHASYVDHLVESLCSTGKKTRRSLLRAHLQFLIGHFLPSKDVNASLKNTIFHKIVFPFLMFSKPRQHTAEAVWSIIASEGSVHEWLRDCPLFSKASEGQIQAEGIDEMIEANSTIATCIARNIAQSKQYVSCLDELVSKLDDTDCNVRVLAHLVCRCLLPLLSGDRQIDAAKRMLKTIRIAEIAALDDMGPGETTEIINDETLGKLVVSKPSSRTTSGWLQISLLPAAINVQRPDAQALNWFEQTKDTGDEGRGSKYVELLRTVYRNANSINSAPLLIVSILSALFETLGNDVLAFLAGIWTTPLFSSELRITNLQSVALHHGSAFLQAHVAAGDDTDFQTILPSLLVPLQSSDPDQRRIAIACISELHKLANTKFKRVYGFDTLYGHATARLQYLDQDDSGKYISLLVQHKEHLIQDSGYLRILHGQHLQNIKNHKKRDNEYRQRVLCFLSSHVVALPTASQTILLRSLDTVADEAKMLSLGPTIAQSFAPSTFNTYIQASETRELLVLLASSFNAAVARDLNSSDSNNWSVFLLVVRQSLSEGASTVLDAILRSLKSGLLAALNSDRRVLLLDAVLCDGIDNSEHIVACKQLLVPLLEDVTIIGQLLRRHQPGSIGDSPRSAKRPKTSEPSDSDFLPHLNLLAEILVAKPLPGSLELVSQLLDTLKAVSNSTTTQADADYLEQLLMAAIEDAASKISEVPNLSPNNIRLDVLVELLRVTENPQTFHQALLLIASLTRLAPDSVLRNVMPIFTFMGSNVFHRDDSYSFKVVQQTVDSIVPIMVASLKEAHSTTLELFRASKPFLRTFTDAAHHIPRHRRLGFFTHLLDVLGTEFLSPLCMLLVEKGANRIVRQTSEEVANLVQLPRSLLENQEPEIQTQTLSDLLNESQRLKDRLIHPESLSPLVLEPVEEEPEALKTGLWRRAKALIIFVAHATKAFASSTTSSRTSQFILILISLTQTSAHSTIQDKLNDLATSAQYCLQRVLSAMHASDFLTAVLSTLQSDQPQIYASGLGLLSDRLPQISPPVRKESLATMTQIIAIVQKLLKKRTNQDQEQAASAFDALTAVATTLSVGEEAAITETIPLILNAVKRDECVAGAYSSLSPLPSKVGPRIIPYYRDIIDQCTETIQKENPDVMDDVCNTIRGLLVSIPTFWGVPEIAKIVSLVIKSSNYANRTIHNSLVHLVKAVVKHVPATVVLPSVLQVWDEPWLNSTSQRGVYMEILRKTIRNTSRTVILDQLKPTFKVFLSSFGSGAGERSVAEDQTITAFRELVVKLNEAAFRSLFRRLYDWAFASESGMTKCLLNRLSELKNGSFNSDAPQQKVVFCHVYSSLLEYFKGLMTPYMSLVLEPLISALETLDPEVSGAESYWLGILQTVSQSLIFDENTFWRDDKLRRISDPVIQQISVCTRFKSSEALTTLQTCLSAIIDTTNDDTLLKNVNLQILMHTRSEEVRVRQAALSSAALLWRNHGTKLLGLVTETATFIAECSEDENDLVVKESFNLKDAVEKAAGNIDGLLDR